MKFKMYFKKKSKCILKKEGENKIKEERKTRNPVAETEFTVRYIAFHENLSEGPVTPDLLNDKNRNVEIYHAQLA